MDKKQLENGIIEIAEKAGQILLHAENPHIYSKEGHANFVTEYDKRIQSYIFEKLHVLLPQASFIGEEKENDFEDNDGFCFCVDPIDGTSNFIAGYRPSVISIALLEDGVPVIGVICNPYTKETFHAVREQGAFVNGKPIQSSLKPLSQSLVVFGTAPYNPEYSEKTFELCRKYLPLCVDLRRSGSAAWDFCCVARGQIGLFFELKLGIWDFAAGVVIAQAAGCRVTDINGDPVRFDGASSIVCASKGVVEEEYLPERF